MKINTSKKRNEQVLILKEKEPRMKVLSSFLKRFHFNVLHMMYRIVQTLLLYMLY